MANQRAVPYDLFIGYSRRGNEQGRELVAFFDRQEIVGMQDWRQRIFQGLRESRLLLACLSPSYLKSEYCEWEFVEYCLPWPTEDPLLN